MDIKKINTPNAPQPAGHYSQATVYNGLVFVAGQLSIDPATGEKKMGSIEEQTELALSNVHEILKAAGSDWDRVLKINISIADIGLWIGQQSLFKSAWGESPRARCHTLRQASLRLFNRDRSRSRHRPLNVFVLVNLTGFH